MSIKLQWMAIPIVAVATLGTGCSMFGKRTVEEAPYQLVQQDGNFEIRQYEPLVVAQTDVAASFNKAGNTAFRKLFAYISGENSTAEKIPMTAPVLADAESGTEIEMTAPVMASQDGGSWRYQFVLPASFTLETAPQPTNPDVTIAEVPAKRMAVLRYAGLLGGKSRTVRAEQLMAWLDKQNLATTSEPQWAGFDPPWTLPPFRRNEVMVEVQ